MFLKISQYSPENTCVAALFNKVTGLKTCNFIKKKIQPKVFPVNIATFLRTALFTEHLWWLLLKFLETFLKVMDNLDGYDWSDDFLLGGDEHSNVIANETGRTVIKVTLHKKWSFAWRISSANLTKSKGNCVICSHLLKKLLMENFIFWRCSVN